MCCDLSTRHDRWLRAANSTIRKLFGISIWSFGSFFFPSLCSKLSMPAFPSWDEMMNREISEKRKIFPFSLSMEFMKYGECWYVVYESTCIVRIESSGENFGSNSIFTFTNWQHTRQMQRVQSFFSTPGLSQVKINYETTSRTRAKNKDIQPLLLWLNSVVFFFSFFLLASSSASLQIDPISCVPSFLPSSPVFDTQIHLHEAASSAMVGEEKGNCENNTQKPELTGNQGEENCEISVKW